jgi:hypothetical protein
MRTDAFQDKLNPTTNNWDQNVYVDNVLKSSISTSKSVPFRRLHGTVLISTRKATANKEPTSSFPSSVHLVHATMRQLTVS